LLKDSILSGCPVSTDYHHLFAFGTLIRRRAIAGLCCSAVSSSRHNGFIGNVTALSVVLLTSWT
jgi:hypothetical protein